MPKVAKPKPRKIKRIKKDCYFTQTNTSPEYKDVLVLKRFVTERGKILSREYSGLTAKNQRLLAVELKKARFMGLLPYTEKHAL